MQRLILICCMLCLAPKANCQTSSFSNGFSASLFRIAPEQPKVRKAMAPKKLIQKINPLFYVGSGLMFIYQNILSDQLQANCQYHISCSEFTKKSVQRYGILRGTFMGINQLNSCIPGIYAEYDPNFITVDLKVENAIYLNNN